jgi:iron complex transport system substrate-binding protein
VNAEPASGGQLAAVGTRYFEVGRRARAGSAGEASSAELSFALLPPLLARCHAFLSAMRIVSLVPHATELLFALGLGDDVVAVTHECDFPEAALSLPHVTRDVLPSGLSAAEIDAAVRDRTERGEAIYELDAERLHDLEPDLIVTQELCPVCAVSYDDVREVASTIATRPKVVALDPHTLGESFGDVRTIAQLTDTRDAALDFIARQRARVDAVRVAVRGAERVPTVALEWFDPVFIAGHWTPQIIELAGGIDVLGFAGERSERATWEMVAAARPRVVVCMPCGYDAERSAQEARDHADALRTLKAERIVAVDAAAYFSRPGPRLVDGLELLAHILHPELVREAPGAVYAIEV